jgi:hypothetical protein
MLKSQRAAITLAGTPAGTLAGTPAGTPAGTLAATTAGIPSLRLVMSLVVFAAIMLAATDLLACPTCKDGIAESDPASQALAAGYFYSILFMMAMPFLIIGTFGGAAYLSIRRARERQPDATLELV